MLKSIKENFVPFLFAAIVIGLFYFPFWSHFNQAEQINTIKEVGGDDMLVGASALFAQNASVQLNLEVLGTYASVSGNFSFSGEIMPDGSTCSNNQILKRTGANDWDCAADASGTVASNSIDWDEIVTAMTLDTNTSIASGAFNLSFGGTNLATIGSASFTRGLKIGNASGDNLFRITNAGVVNAGTWNGTAITDAFVADAITINGGTIGSNNISATSTWTTLGTLTIGDGGDAVDFATSTWDITAGVLTGLTISTNNVTGTWTTTGNLTIGDNGDDIIIDSDTWNVSSLGAFTGVTGLTSTGVIDFNGASQFTLALNATINSDGDLSFHSASNSLDIWNGTNTTAIDTVCTERKTFVVDSPTADNPKWVGQVQFDNPFTITKISQVATQSNSAGWNAIYGPANSQTTKVFTLEKSASNSSVYTSFANSTVLDGNVLSVVISSTSATLDSFSVTICGFLNH